ncbi:MAG TPA: hypothetical protein VHG91_18320 [Longimicrobium sp.]|nr:hypothetical protein [Longimicrobium sp.]
MSVRINEEQAAAFVQQALARAVPGVAFTVRAHRDPRGGPGLEAAWTTAGGERGSTVFPLPPSEHGSWDAGSLVYMAVRHFTAPFDLLPEDRDRDRAA